MAPYPTSAANADQYKQDITSPGHMSRTLETKILVIVALFFSLLLVFATTFAVLRVKRHARRQAATLSEETPVEKADPYPEFVDWPEVSFAPNALSLPIFLPDKSQRGSARSSLLGSFIARPFSRSRDSTRSCLGSMKPAAPSAPGADCDLEAQLKAEFAAQLALARSPVLKCAADWPVYIPPQKASILEFPVSLEKPATQRSASLPTVKPEPSSRAETVEANAKAKDAQRAASRTATRILVQHSLPIMLSPASQPPTPTSPLPRNRMLDTAFPVRDQVRYLEIPLRSFCATNSDRSSTPVRPISATSQKPFVLGAPPRSDRRVAKDKGKVSRSVSSDTRHRRSIRPAIARSHSAPIPTTLGATRMHIAPSDGRYPKMYSPKGHAFAAPILPAAVKTRQRPAVRRSVVFQQIFGF